jgi:hypothetical protein
MSVIEEVRSKCEEIQAQVEFIYTLAGKAQDPKWVENDPGYTHILAVYTAAKGKLADIVGELP